MSSDIHESSSTGRLYDYFSIIGLKQDVGLQLFEGNTSQSQVVEDNLMTPPLTRSYKSYILGRYPDYVAPTPFDEEAVQMLSLPRGLQLRTQKHKLDPHFHPFIITREDASQYYGFTYTFYEEVNTKQICTSLYSLQSVYLTNVSCTQGKSVVGPVIDPNNRPSHSLPRQIRLCSSQGADAMNFYDITKDQLFVTKCITLMGPHPAIMAAWKFLHDLYKVFTECDTDTITLESYVYNILYEVPSPPRGKCLSFTCIKQELLCQKPSSNELPHFEYSLQEFFSLLGIDTVMQLLTCVLLENQIIILSSDYYRLMLVSECVCSLIFPFLWQNVYVPILPASLLHFLDAPVPFIMGIQTEVENDVIRIPNEANLCLLDIDRGSIEVPEDMPQIPYKQEIHRELMQFFDSWVASVTTKLDRNLNEQLIDYKSRRRRKVSNSQEPDVTACTRDSFQRMEFTSTKSPFSTLDSLKHLADSTRPFQQTVRASSLPKAKGSKIPDGKIEPFTNSAVSRTGKGPELRLWKILPKKEDSNWVIEVLKFNNSVREIFLNWFVQMFCSYENFITVPNIREEDMEQWLTAREALHSFDKATFLVDQPDAHLPFLSRFIESQLFTSLIDQKILSGNKNSNVRIFDLRIRLLRDKYDDSVVRSTSYDSCSTIEETEQLLIKRVNNLDFKAPPPQSIDPMTESCTHFNPGHFPLLDKVMLNREPIKSKRRGVKAWHRRERQALHLEQVAFSPDQREKVLQEARLLALSHPKLADMSPAHMAHTNWKFVEQLLKECKTRTKRMLVQKMGSEAIELGHGEGSLVGVEENTLIASLCDLLERIWSHGLQRKQGKSALWSHLLNYQEGLNESCDGDQILNPNFLSPAMAWGILRKRIDNLSSRALEMESAPSSPTHTPSSRMLSGRSRSMERTSDRGFSDWKSSRNLDHSGMNIAINPLPVSVSFDMKNVLSMPEIKTEIGYARAWVRLSLEKKLLSRHLGELLVNTDLLRSLYKRYAFLRCEDEKEQFLSYLLSLNAVDYFCFTNKYNTSIFPYRVIIFPSRKLNAATTSANAWVSIGGTSGHTTPISVPKGHNNEFTFQHKNLGLLTTLRVGHDNSGISPKWMVEHILVRNEVSGHTWKFPCGRWLGRGIDDGSLERILVGELVPSHITSEDLVETCRTPPRCRSPNIPGPRKSDAKLTPPQIQQLLGDAVNSIVKFFYKPERERGSLTLLLCGDLGLVFCLESAFSYGFKSTRLFGKNLYLWDYFGYIDWGTPEWIFLLQAETGFAGISLLVEFRLDPKLVCLILERVQQNFETALREEVERQQLTGLIKDDRMQEFSIMAKFIKLTSKINSSSSQLGKDDKFQLFVCIAARDHLLHRLLLPLQRCPITSQMYDESAFFRDPLLVRDLINVLSALSEFEFTLEKTLTRGIEM